jgi:hypothetical protein
LGFYEWRQVEEALVFRVPLGHLSKGSGVLFRLGLSRGLEWLDALMGSGVDQRSSSSR